MKYIATYREKELKIEAESMFWAKQEAIHKFDIPKQKQGLLTIVEVDEDRVEHTTVD